VGYRHPGLKRFTPSESISYGGVQSVLGACAFPSDFLPLDTGRGVERRAVSADLAAGTGGGAAGSRLTTRSTLSSSRNFRSDAVYPGASACTMCHAWSGSISLA